MDVRNWFKHLKGLPDSTEMVLRDDQVEFFISRATAVVNMHMFHKYSADDLIQSSWAGVPVPYHSNAGNVVLYGASAGASAYTELWTVTCGTTTFTITGNLQGSLSGAAYASDFQATDISILASAWSGTPTTSDIYYVPTYDRYQAIVTVTSMLAAGYALNSEYTEEVPNASTYGVRLENGAMDLLKRLADPEGKNGLAFDTSARISGDIEPIAQSYVIDETGTDVTEYYPDRGDREGESKLADD